MTYTRSRLLTATIEMFRRQGYNGTGLKDVIAAAGATTGSLYHFFPGGKRELAAVAITESGAAYQALFELIADESATPATAIRAFFDGAADALAAGDYLDLCPIGTVAGEIASTDPVLREAADAVFQAWVGAAAQRFHDAGLDRSTAERLATAVVAALEGGFVLARCRRDAGVLRATGREMEALVAHRLTDTSGAPRRHVQAYTYPPRP